MGSDRGALADVEMLADFVGSVNMVVEVRDERGNGALEVDIVLPERIVGVDKQRLVAEARGERGGLNRAHAPILTGALRVDCFCGDTFGSTQLAQAKRPAHRAGLFRLLSCDSR